MGCRNKIVRFRVSDSEYRQMKKICNSLGVNTSEFMRLCIEFFSSENNKNMFVRKDLDSRKIMKNLACQLARIGNNLNQTTRFINRINASPDIELDRDAIAQINDSLYAFTVQFIDLCETYNTKAKIRYKLNRKPYEGVSDEK